MTDSTDRLGDIERELTTAIENGRTLSTLLNHMIPEAPGTYQWTIGPGEANALRHLAGQATGHALAIQEMVHEMIKSRRAAAAG